MSDILSSDVKKPMEQPEHDLSKAMGQLTVTTDNSRKSSPSLSDMPIDVVGLIIERSKYKEQLKLRKVSKSLRALVDNRKPACKSIQVVFSEEGIGIKMDYFYVTYAASYVDCDVFPFRDDEVLIIRDDFKKAAFDDLISTLKNPKLQLEKLSVCFGYSRNKNIEIEKCCNEIRNVLESLNHRVSVKEINLQGSIPSCLLSILPYLKQGVLEKISLDEFDSNRHANEMDQVALLDQWKQAEALKLQFCFDEFPLEYAKNYKRFLIIEDRIDGDNFIRIKDFLSKLDNFERCTLFFWEFADGPESVHELLGEPVSSNATEEIFHYSITEPACYLELTKPINGYEIKIERKKRENN